MNYKYLFLVVLLFSGCFSDKGNYDYTELNDVIIEGVSDQIAYEQLSYRDTLRIQPKITLRDGGDLSNLSYEWKLVPIGLNSKPEGKDFVIGREKNLEYHVTVGLGRYLGLYRVENKSTGAIYSKRFFLNTRELTSYGLAILCDNNGTARFDWIFRNTETEDIVMKDLWASRPEDTQLMGKPISLSYFDYDLGKPIRRFRMVNCEKGSFCLDTAQMAGEAANIKYRFASNKDEIYVRGGHSQIKTINFIPIIDKNGDVYIKGTSSTAVLAYRSNKVLGEANYFEAAPFVAPPVMVGGGGSTQSTLFYDQTNCRFVEIRKDYSPIASFTVSKLTGEGAVTVQPTANREMLFMETTTGLSTFAILRDKTTKQNYLYGFKLNANNLVSVKYCQELNATDIDNAIGYLFNNVYEGCLFYITKDKLYRYNASSGTSEELLSFPGEEIVKISTFKSTTFGSKLPQFSKDYKDRITLATNDKTTGSGIIRFYDVPSNTTPLVLYREHKGFGKIVDVCHFE